MAEQCSRVEYNSVQARLSQPARGNLTIFDLNENWFDQTVWVRLKGGAKMPRRLNFLNDIRRSVGGAFGAGASPGAHDGQPCPWEPPCALDVFYREQLRIDGNGLPKPYVLLADTVDADLLVGLRVFGFATEWMPSVEHAFVDALRHRIPWQKWGQTPELIERRIDTFGGVELTSIPQQIEMRWLTQIDAEAGNPKSQPGSILTRMHRRLSGFARWHDGSLEALDDRLLMLWEQSVDTEQMSEAKPYRFWSGASDREVQGKCSSGTLRVSVDEGILWPMLKLGERCGVGRGAVRGMGRYQVSKR